MKRALILLLLVCRPSLAQQEPFSSQVHVTAIDVIAEITDKTGHTPADLQPTDFVILEDGEERTVIALDYLGATERRPGAETTPAPLAKEVTWQIVLYIDLELSSSATVRNAVASLAAESERLTALGQVDVIVANPSPRRLLAASRNPDAVRETLLAAGKLEARDRLVQSRREFLEDIRGRVNTRDAEMRIAIRPAAHQERLLIEQFHSRLSGWMSRYPNRAPKALLLVSDGFDLEPVEFYEEFLGQQLDRQKLHADLALTRSVEESTTVARDLAASGWTILGLTGGVLARFPDEAASSGGKRISDFKRGASTPSSFILHGRDPLETLAENSGGLVESNPQKFGRTLEALSDRVRLTYQVSRPADAQVRKIEVRPLREGLRVVARRWVSATTPEMVAGGRAANLLEGDSAEGELPLGAKIELRRPRTAGEKREGTLEAKLSLKSLEKLQSRLTATTIRVTIAVGRDGDSPVIRHELIEAYDASKNPGIDYGATLELPSNATNVAIVIEELTTGGWGSAVIPLQGNAAGQRIFLSDSWPEPTPGQLGSPPRVSGIEWIQYSAVRKRAIAEKKLIFAYIRPIGCRGCADIDRNVLSHPAVQRRLTDFLSVSMDVTSAKGAFGDELTENAGFAIVDPWGRLRMLTRPMDAPGLVDYLLRAYSARNEIIDAGELLNAGESAKPHFLLGFAYLNAGYTEKAKQEYQTANRLAIAEGNRELAQRARIQLSYAMVQSGARASGRSALEKILEEPLAPEIEAEAWLILGHIRKKGGDAEGATDAYSRAAMLAPPGSTIHQVALTLSGSETPPVTVVESSGARVLKPIQIVRQARAVLSGRVTFHTLVRDPAIDRVRFLVDGQQVREVRQPPFSAGLDLGKEPRPHSILVRAFSHDGRIIGEDTVLVNERHDDFRVRILEPDSSEKSGSTMVRLDLTVPAGQSINRVEIFWDQEPLATLRQSPYSTTVTIPAVAGVLRAAAVLEDGRTTEDSRLLNASGYAETIDVELVNTYVRVTDGRGNPVRDLAASDFIVTEEGKRRSLVRAEFQERPPLLIGLAVDTSTSMREEIVDVQSAAREFLQDGMNVDSRAFVVGFGESPRLLHETSGDVAALQRSVDSLRATGSSTALYDALVFALLQFAGTSGKKALVVVTDGRDQASRYSVDDVVVMARRLGVSIHAIVIDSSYFAYDRKLGPIRHEMETLTRQSGGKAFYLRTARDIDQIYREIDQELGSQYLIAFRATGASSTDWKDIEIRTTRKGSKVQSAGGYIRD